MAASLLFPALAHLGLATAVKVAMHNDALPMNSTNYTENAQWWYDRFPSRVSPFDLDLEVLDSSGRSILECDHMADYILRVASDLWLWNPEAWQDALAALGTDAVVDPAALMAWKAGAYWELTAQLAAERIFGPWAWRHSAIQLLGPGCVTAHGDVLPVCADNGLADAATVNVTTYIDGARDPLMPVSRVISLVAYRNDTGMSSSFDISVEYVVEVPAGLHVGSPHREMLDMRPYLGIDERRVSAPLLMKARSVGATYPDYNRLFLPMRHLLLQGEVERPMRPETAIHYANASSLRQAAAELLAAMRFPETASNIVMNVTPFMTEKYYYMFDEYADGVAPYREYILAAVAEGWDSAYESAELVLGMDGHSTDIAV